MGGDLRACASLCGGPGAGVALERGAPAVSRGGRRSEARPGGSGSVPRDNRPAALLPWSISEERLGGAACGPQARRGCCSPLSYPFYCSGVRYIER